MNFVSGGSIASRASTTSSSSLSASPPLSNGTCGRLAPPSPSSSSSSSSPSSTVRGGVATCEPSSTSLHCTSCSSSPATTRPSAPGRQCTARSGGSPSGTPALSQLSRARPTTQLTSSTWPSVAKMRSVFLRRSPVYSELRRVAWIAAGRARGRGGGAKVAAECCSDCDCREIRGAEGERLRAVHHDRRRVSCLGVIAHLMPPSPVRVYSMERGALADILSGGNSEVRIT